MYRSEAEDTNNAMEKALKKTEKELRAAQRQLQLVLDILEKQQAQLSAHETSIARLDRITMEMLTSRVWRTLRAAGNVAKRFVPGQKNGSGQSISLDKQPSFLACDEPREGDVTLRSGAIAVRGWALAEGGVEAVEIDVPPLEPIQVLCTVARPDVKKAYPHLDATGRAGYVAEFDSLLLPNGRHPITVRLISRGKAVRKSTTSVQIDHQNGFVSEYYRWIRHFEEPANELIQLKVPSLKVNALFSVLMPVFNTKPDELRAAIDSVIEQSYPNWELCIADDCSSNFEIRDILQDYAQRYSNVKLVFCEENGGISRACNSAWQIASGDYFCFLDHDDTLSVDALAYVCEALEKEPEADLLYSDEDKIDKQGKRFDPFFKPQWSPDLLLSENYICHLLVLRRDLADKIGHLNPDCDGSQDYDLILRATEAASKIAHVPRVLYHWRATEGSTAVTVENKQYAISAAQLAIERHIARTGLDSSVIPGKIAGRWRMKYAIPEGTQVSIIIASGGKLNVLETNVESLFSKTTYKQFEVVVIDNSKEKVIESFVRAEESKEPRLRYIDWRNKPFNYSAINNAAARECKSPVFLFLNDDTAVIEPGWLEAMVELAVRPEVGVVGAKLLYPTGSIQHGGVVMGLYDNCGHAFKGLDGSVGHYFDFPDVVRNVSAVTGACLMTRAELFWKVGGFDEETFAVAFNDIDLCLKIGSAGYRVLYTPHALLYHYEAFSKTSKDLVPHPKEVEAMREKWDFVIKQDPYYNPNLTRNHEDYSLRTRN